MANSNARGETMKRGIRVMIFQDPITEKKEEGIATVIRRVADSANGLGRFMVHFHDGTGQVYERAIKEPLKEVNE